MLEGVLANMLRQSLLEGDLETFQHVKGLHRADSYMLEGVLANMLRQSARWRPFTCWWEC